MAATKTKQNPQKAIDMTAKAIEEAATKAQDQYFSVLEQGQAVAIESLEALFSAVDGIELPAVPGLDALPGLDAMPEIDVMKIQADAFEGAFQFASKMIENQRTFAQKVMAVSTKS